MSTAFMYQADSSQPFRDLQAIAAATMRGVKKRAWSNEGFHLAAKPNLLVGSTKLFSDSITDEDLRATAADVGYLITVLQRLAREHGLVWRISCGDDLGTIDADRVDPRVMDFSKVLGATNDILGDNTSKPSKPMVRRPTLLPKKQITGLRQRWSAERLAALRPLIDAGERAALVAFCGEHQGSVDLRGLDLAVIPELSDGQTSPVLTGCDLSHCHSPPIMWTPRHRIFRACRFDGALFTAQINGGHFQSCSFICATFDDLRASAEFNDCDFTHTRFNRFKLGSGVFSDCRFAHSRLRKADLGGSRFIRCDFNDADLAGSTLGWSAFVSCSFIGACFTGAFYGDTVFKSCSGLDAACMEAERWSVLGEYISDPPVITNDLSHPDRAATVSTLQLLQNQNADQQHKQRVEDMCKREGIELFPAAGEKEAKRIAATMSDEQIEQLITHAQDLASAGQAKTSMKVAADIIRAFAAELQIICAWSDHHPAQDQASREQRKKRVNPLIGLGIPLIELYQQRISAFLAASTT